jgi:L-amino acid N-acyltransferase YncA
MPIRDAVKDDLPRIVEIYNASIPGRAATADTEPVTVQSRVDWFESHDPETRPLWVMEVQTDQGLAIAGWISLRDYYGRPAYHATAEIALYIAPEHQGNGYGSKLLGLLIEHAAKHGVKNLLSFVFGHNEASIRLNERFGFEKWGHLPGVAQLDDDWRDLVILGLKLDAKDHSDQPTDQD